MSLRRSRITFLPACLPACARMRRRMPASPWAGSWVIRNCQRGECMRPSVLVPGVAYMAGVKKSEDKRRLRRSLLFTGAAQTRAHRGRCTREEGFLCPFAEYNLMEGILDSPTNRFDASPHFTFSSLHIARLTISSHLDGARAEAAIRSSRRTSNAYTNSIPLPSPPTSPPAHVTRSSPPRQHARVHIHGRRAWVHRRPSGAGRKKR